MRREVIRLDEPAPTRDLKKPIYAVIGAVSLSLFIVYLASQRDEDDQPSTAAVPASDGLVPDRGGADALAELAIKQRAERERRAMKAPASPSESLPVVRGRPPKVSEVIDGASPEPGDWPQEVDARRTGRDREDPLDPTAIRKRDTVLAQQHRTRVIQRQLQQKEESLFPKSMSVEAFDRSPSGARAPQTLEEREEEKLSGLNALSDALLHQSASQVRTGSTLSAGGGLEALRGLAVAELSAPPDTIPNGRDARNLAFFQKGGGQLQPGYLLATVQKPLTPYELKMGSVIPGVLISAIHSESPGQILGQVSENVYDSVHQDHLLIPQGTKIVGTYSGAISLGQERVQVAAVRLNFPDGSTLDLGGMSVAEATGQAGLSDRVNHHLLRRVAAALLTTSATAGYAATRPANALGIEGSVHQALGESIMKLASDMAARDQQIPPTLEIRSGQRFVIHVNKDVVFPGPYQDGYPHRMREARARAERRRQQVARMPREVRE